LSKTDFWPLPAPSQKKIFEAPRDFRLLGVLCIYVKIIGKKTCGLVWKNFSAKFCGIRISIVEICIFPQKWISARTFPQKFISRLKMPESVNLEGPQKIFSERWLEAAKNRFLTTSTPLR